MVKIGDGLLLLHSHYSSCDAAALCFCVSAVTRLWLRTLTPPLIPYRGMVFWLPWPSFPWCPKFLPNIAQWILWMIHIPSSGESIEIHWTLFDPKNQPAVIYEPSNVGEYSIYLDTLINCNYLTATPKNGRTFQVGKSFDIIKMFSRHCRYITNDVLFII